MNFQELRNPKELVFQVISDYVKNHYGDTFDLIRCNSCTEIPDLVIRADIYKGKQPKLYQLVVLAKNHFHDRQHQGISYRNMQTNSATNDRFEMYGYITEDLVIRIVDIGISEFLKENGASELANDPELLNDFIGLQQKFSVIRNFLNIYQRALKLYTEFPCFEPDPTDSDFQPVDKQPEINNDNNKTKEYD